MIKGIMIPNYPELTVRRDIDNFSLPFTRYDQGDNRGLGKSERELLEEMVAG